MTAQILMIDPDIHFMVSIKTALEGTREFQVKLASTLFMVDEQLRHGSPDVAVVAFNLPDLAIMELLQHIRQLRPDLPLVMTPDGPQEIEHAQFLDADAILDKPYGGRDLIPVVRSVLSPMAADVLEELEALDQIQIDQPDDAPAQRDPGGTRLLDRDHSDYLDHAAGVTQRLDETDPYPPDAERSLPQTKPLPSRYDEPVFKEGDTPSVPDHDSPAMRTFLATDQGHVPPDDFGEALDAIARARAAEETESPDAFRDLVDSMRPAESRGRGSRLADLIQSLSPDQADAPDRADSGVDALLDAIRQGRSLRGEMPVPELDDTTIGEVIGGLFEPSFEDVLAALAGWHVDDDAIQEPAYAVENAMEQEDAVRPPTLPEEGSTEPPVEVDDSRSYPATAALTALSAVSGEGDAAGQSSLDALLNQIEAQLPPARSHRPRLKPLPSWQEADLTLGGRRVAALFDHDRDTIEPEPAPEMSEPDISQDDTLPSQALIHAMETVQDDLTRPVLPVLPDEDEDSYTGEAAAYETEPDFEPEPGEHSVAYDDEADADTGPVGVVERAGEPDHPGEPARVPDAEPPLDEFDTAFEIEFDTNVLTMADLLAIADLPEDAGTEEIQREIMERAARAGQPVFPPDESELVPLDSDTAAMIIETGASSVAELDRIEDQGEDPVLAAIAVQLTQFSLENSVRATMISRPGQRLAEAGDLAEAAMDRLFELVERAWLSTQVSGSLIRYITLPVAGECLLYSTQVELDLFLSMVFHSSTSVRTIRKQAQRLSESLALVPEDPEPPAARTQISRPTDMVPPEGWEEAVRQAQDLAVDESVPVRPAHMEDVSYTAYTCLWLPADPTLELLGDLAEALAVWIEEIAADSAWAVDSLAIFPDYVLVALRAPEKSLPDQVIMHLMAETTRLSADYFPGAGSGGPLWTDGYYLVSPPRELSEREVARFITYQRQAQLG